MYSLQEESRSEEKEIRSLNHSYKNENKHKDSFMHLHQENNEDENFKLSVTRFMETTGFLVKLLKLWSLDKEQEKS